MLYDLEEKGKTNQIVKIASVLIFLFSLHILLDESRSSHLKEVVIKQATLFGDGPDAPYHPVTAVQDCFKHSLSSAFDVQTSHEMVNPGNLANIDLCILYYDLWMEQVPLEATETLTRFVDSGGGLLVVHNGISLQGDPLFCHFIGAKFTRHPERQKVAYQPVEEHVITRGIGPFDLEEELYLFEHFGMDRFKVLLQGRLQQTFANALWIRESGLGRLAYFAIGHDSGSLSHATVARLISNTAQWLVKII